LTSDHSKNVEIKGGHGRSLNLFRRFEGTDEVNNFQKRVGGTKRQDLKWFKKRGNLDAGKFCFGNRVWEEWNSMPGCQY